MTDDTQQAAASAEFRRAMQLHQEGRLEEAERAYRKVLDLNPFHAPALINRGAALRDLGRAAEALESYDRALMIDPAHAQCLNNRGVALIDLGRLEEAVESFDQALRLNPDYPEALNNRGRALATAETELTLISASDARADAALASFGRAIALRPDYAEAHDNRGSLLFELGRAEDAAAAVERAIRLSPRTARYYYHLAQIRRFASGDPFLQAMRQLALAPLPEADRIELLFALGKALDEAGDPAAAFASLEAANRLKRRSVDYDEAAALQDLRQVAERFGAETLWSRAGLGDPSPLPVFVVGMPRSGTTLVEQILASHPDARGAGESSIFGQIAGPDLGADPAALSGKALRRIGASYVSALAAAAPGAKRVVNKRPDNFRFAGLIHLALPAARIVHVRRDAMDVGLSCFSRLFGQDVPYSFDLGEIGRYIRGYEALMGHWREVLPPEVLLEVDYEALVEDLEGQTRRILAHCGLRWNPACLDFHVNRRRIRTASAAQVRQPLYASSVGRWRAYQAFLAPLEQALAA